nr:MAG TPA: Protein of unknown function (DUF1642) [Caudoviricetes sp.]
MNKQELIKHFEEMDYVSIHQMGKQSFIDLIEQLDEPQKPVVPQVVMDYYEFYRGKLTAFEEWFAKFEVECDEDFQQMDEVGKWLYDVDFETQTQRELALAMLIVNGSDAVEVEKEKRYYVRFKLIEDSYSYLTLIKHLNAWTLYSITLDKKFRTEHTKKQLEDAGFGWVFDCPGVEIEEVE